MMQHKLLPRVISALLAGVMLLSTLAACKNSDDPADATAATTTVPSGTSTDPGASATPTSYGMVWPEGQIFPTFSYATSGKLDVITNNNLSTDELITYTCLEGIVNAGEGGIRLGVYVDNVEKWASTYRYRAKQASTEEKRQELIEKYASEISGVVLYSSKQVRNCTDFYNLATTVANIHGAIPLSKTIYDRWKKAGIELPIVEDLTDLDFSNRLDVYQHLYDNYWKDCTKRILFVQNPEFAQMRDYSSATGAAVVYLSCKSENAKELSLFRKFLKDMTPGKSILMGWNGEERELMTVCASAGLSCVPADFFSGPSIFAQDIDVEINPVPDMPQLENKIYIAFYFSDGDNIQYNMNAMREYWDNSAKFRGQVPINWTISPALVDVAPGMMNYYYKSATDAECFVAGPSGLGYTMPINTWGPNTGNAFRDNDDFRAFVKMTNNYLAKSGLRTVTIWDDLSKKQREIYSEYGTYLYGLTVQNFTNGSPSLGMTGVTNNLLIHQQTPGYFAKGEDGVNPPLSSLGVVDEAISYFRYNGKAPIFISIQVSVWGFHDVQEVVNWEKTLSQKYSKKYGGDVVEFVRADHFFNLYYQANGLPYDLTLRSDLSVSASSASDKAALVADGTQSTVWEADGSGEQYLLFDLAGKYDVSELSVFFAESASKKYSKNDNVKALRAEISADGQNWTKLTELSDNTDAWVNLRFDPAGGRYLRITVTDPGQSGIARIADVNIKGIAS